METGQPKAGRILASGWHDVTGLQNANIWALRHNDADVQNISRFRLRADINDKILSYGQGDIQANTISPENGFMILKFDKKLQVGDIIYYWFDVQEHSLRYKSEVLEWKVLDLLDKYSILRPICISAITVINGRTSCVGDVFIDDEFKEPLINNNLWTVEHRIPTYVGPNFEFNYYENSDETLFFRDNKLFLKPMITNNIRGHLNLRQGCTSTRPTECYYENRSVFYLPPVKSARITSKIPFKYGKVDIKARLPAGDWIFPIIQLEPLNSLEEHPPRVFIAYNRGNEFLKEKSPLDIDIRVDNLKDVGSNLLLAGPVVYSSEPKRSKYLISKQDDIPFYSDFHIYSLEWKQDIMIFSIDNKEYGIVSLMQNFAIPELNVGTTWTTQRAPFNQEYVLSLGVAVGGQYGFPDGYISKSGTKPWTSGIRTFLKDFYNAQSSWLKTWSADTVALEIDYVKVTAI